MYLIMSKIYDTGSVNIAGVLLPAWLVSETL
jgi:hypothetical protein